MIRTLLALLITLNGLSFAAHAQTAIRDPKNLLEKVDAFLDAGKIPMETALKCGQLAVFDHPIDHCDVACSADGCWSSCQTSPKTVTHTVSECTADQVSIFSDDAENVSFTREEYQDLHGNLVRKFMANLSAYVAVAGQLELTQIEAVTFVLDPSVPGSQSFPALNISGKFWLDGFHDGPPVMFTVLKDAPGVAQLARFRLMADTWFRLKSLPKGN